MENLERARRSVPITYMIFDILYAGGKWVMDLPLVERQGLLEKVIIPGDTVQLVENFYEGEALYKIIESQGMEGIVAKNLNSKYLIKGKDKRWQKRKNYRDIIAVIGGVTLRGPVVNSVLLGLYDGKGQFWYIGHAGTGKLSHGDWRELTERIKPLIITAKPFVNKPERLKDAVWLEPKITAKIKFTEWTEGHSLRQPSIQAFVDLPPEKCILE